MCRAVSALLLDHPSGTWRLQAVSQQELQAFAEERLPPYQVPHTVIYVDAIPRNAMGKVNKKQLGTLF